MTCCPARMGKINQCLRLATPCQPLLLVPTGAHRDRVQVSNVVIEVLNTHALETAGKLKRGGSEARGPFLMKDVHWIAN
jgi:hypothetical protein